jgi:outer membrane protein assembly factor BamB
MAMTVMVQGRLGAEARWPRFRGENGQGVAERARPPVEFGAGKNLLWKMELPAGNSSPCIWDDKIFLTGFVAGKLETLCIDRKDGKILWRQTAAAAQKMERVTRANGLATPTPTTDGERVYVLFGSFGLIAYDLEGREQWRKALPLVNVRHGTATSPILAGGKLIVACDQEDMKSFLIAVDPADGKTLWQVDRPMSMSSHTTPIAWKHNGVEEVIVAGSVRLVAYDLKDGTERWSCRGLEPISICPSPALGEGMIFVASLSMGEKLPSFADALGKCDGNKDGKLSFNEGTKLIKDVFHILDTNSDNFLTAAEWDAWYGVFGLGDHGLFGVREPEKGDVTQTHVVWKEKKGIPEVASPLYYRGRVFGIRNGGFASCIEAKTGKVLYQDKRIGAEGQYYASPVAADGKIYVASTTGLVSVIEAGDELKVLAKNDLGEAIAATPAIVENRIYIRTAEHLWAFGE